MGYYIEGCEGKTKVGWLEANTTIIPLAIVTADDWEYEDKKDNVLICLINNGPFLAAGIAYSLQEFKCFNTPDGREKIWFSVPKSAAIKNNPNVAHYLKPYKA